MTRLIIALCLFAAAVHAKPLPETAMEAEGAAEYAFKAAKTEADFAAAADQYAAAAKAAPWHPPYYFNEGVAREKAGQPEKAVECFEKYLKASPKAKDASAVRKRIGGLKFAAKKKADDQSPEGQARKRAEGEQALLKSLDGVRFVRAEAMGNGDVYTETIDIRGGELITGGSHTFGEEMLRLNPGRTGMPWSEISRIALTGRSFALPKNYTLCWSTCPADCRSKGDYFECPKHGEIQPDGFAILIHGQNAKGGGVRTVTFNRER